MSGRFRPPEVLPLGWRNGACSSGMPASCADAAQTDKPDFPAKLCGTGDPVLSNTQGHDGKQRIEGLARLNEKLEGFPGAARRVQCLENAILSGEAAVGREELS